ncbi:hypothetical protein MASR1M97_01640 [Candidatus Desulfobacillus denitrificans]
MRVAVGRIHAGVVGQGAEALAAEEGRRLLDLAPRQAVHDAGLAGMFGAQEGQQLGAGVGLLDDLVADVGTVEAGDEDARAAKLQVGDDFLACRLVGGGGERDARHLGPALVQEAELEVLRAEVVAPLRDAVRLVDGEEGEAVAGGLAELVREVGREQPLRRDVEQVEFARHEGAAGAVGLLRRLAGMQAGGAHAGFEERRHLVLHQGDQRRDDEGRARPQQGRDLVAQRLAAAGGHQHQGVAAAGDLFDDLGLLAAEGRVAEDLVEDGKRRHRSC